MTDSYDTNYFAVLDDSTARENGIVAYAHALHVYDNFGEECSIKTICCVGPKDDVYNGRREIDILKFIDAEVPDDCPLYACSHYMQYPSIWNRVDLPIDKKMPKIVKKAFDDVDKEARRESTRKLQEYLLRCSNSAENNDCFT